MMRSARKSSLGWVSGEVELARIRLRTLMGWPLGSDSFLSELEALLGRRLRALPPGRPRKGKARASKRE